MHIIDRIEWCFLMALCFASASGIWPCRSDWSLLTHWPEVSSLGCHRFQNLLNSQTFWLLNSVAGTCRWLKQKDMFSRETNHNTIAWCAYKAERRCACQVPSFLTPAVTLYAFLSLLVVPHQLLVRHDWWDWPHFPHRRWRCCLLLQGGDWLGEQHNIRYNKPIIEWWCHTGLRRMILGKARIHKYTHTNHELSALDIKILPIEFKFRYIEFCSGIVNVDTEVIHLMIQGQHLALWYHPQ
jgi:hypothetical protein